MTVEIKPFAQNARIIRHIQNLDRVTKQNIRKVLYDSGRDLKKDAVSLINAMPKHGRTYFKQEKRGKFRVVHGKRVFVSGGALKKPKIHIASAPFEAPAVMTGRLRGSIMFKVSSWHTLEFAVHNVPYARDLEYRDIVHQVGQVTKKIAPRPFISDAYKKNWTKMHARLRTLIFKSLTKS